MGNTLIDNKYLAKGKLVLTFKKAKGRAMAVAKKTTRKTSNIEFKAIFKIL
tara:strand:+ start:798 stop:950 length:153 start_codon:yes stop_codon:yes gene_type:complete